MLFSDGPAQFDHRLHGAHLLLNEWINQLFNVTGDHLEMDAFLFLAFMQPIF